MVHLSSQTIAAAQGAQAQWKVPASVTLAQYGLESAWGAKQTGDWNYFGIKARPGEPSKLCPTHEYVGGRYVPVDAAFASYPSMEAGFEAHAKLLATAPIYAPAMAALPDVQKFVTLMAAHYATAPNYAQMIMEIINSDDLTQYDA